MESASIKALTLLTFWVWCLYKLLICFEIFYLIPIGIFYYLVILLEEQRHNYLILLMENMDVNIKMDEFSQTTKIITKDATVQASSETIMDNKQSQCDLDNEFKTGACSKTDISTKAIQLYKEINTSDKATQYDWQEHTKIDAICQTIKIVTKDQSIQATPAIRTKNKKAQYTLEKQIKNISSQSIKIPAKDTFIQTIAEINTSNKKSQAGNSRSEIYRRLYPAYPGFKNGRYKRLRQKIKFKPTLSTIQESDEDTFIEKESNESDIPEQDPSLRVIHFAGKEIRYRVNLSLCAKLSSIPEGQETTSNEKTLDQKMSKQSPIPAPSKNKQYADDPNQQYSGRNAKEPEMKQKGENMPYFRKKFRMLNLFLKK